MSGENTSTCALSSASADTTVEVQTTSAQSLTTNTAVQNTTIVNSSSRTVTYQTTRQTCERQQRAVVTETVTRRAPTAAELAELCNLGTSLTITTTSSGSESAAPKPAAKSFKSRGESGESPVAVGGWRDKSVPRPAPRTNPTAVTLSRSEQTSVTQSSGRSESTTVEQHCFKRDAFGEALTSQSLHAGDAYIFSNDSLKGLPVEMRSGIALEVDALRTTFEHFKMNVQVIKDAKLERIQATISEIERADYTHHACVVIAVLSHGSFNDVVGGNDLTFSLNDHVIAPMLRNATLKGKPKMILVQASKSNMDPSEISAYAKYTDGEASELLMCYSAFDGYGSCRHDQSDSPFIEALCEHLKDSGQTEDLTAILKKVIRTVQANPKTKQAPKCIGSLSKRFVFGDYC